MEAANGEQVPESMAAIMGSLKFLGFQNRGIFKPSSIDSDCFSPEIASTFVGCIQNRRERDAQKLSEARTSTNAPPIAQKPSRHLRMKAANIPSLVAVQSL